jgi:glycosyltransferase involved in cell wall biosynthesis
VSPGRRAGAAQRADRGVSQGIRAFGRTTRSRLGLRAYRAAQRARNSALTMRDVTVMASALARAAATRRDARTAPGGRRILMLTISTVEHDPRIRKVARSLAERDYAVDIMAPAAESAGSEQDVEPGVRHVRVPLRSIRRLALVYQEEFRRHALRRSFDYVHANDLTTLTVGWAIARVRRVPLVYDAHELWTENVEYDGREWVPMSRRTRLVADRWERFLLRDVDLVVTVGPSIAEDFERRDSHARRPLLLANYPSLGLPPPETAARTIRDECGLGDAHFVTLYLGGVNPLRNIEGVIRAHAQLPPHHVFVVRGPGVELFEEEYRALARRLGVEDRVFFLPPVAMDDVLVGAAGADCGIVMLRNICRNFWLFYPNKLFEYAFAGLPIAVSDFPDAGRYVREERCGVTFDPDSPHSIAAALLALGSDREAARAMGERGRASILAGRNWETAVEGLVTAYDRLA